MRGYFPLLSAHPPFLGQPFQQLAQGAFLDSGGGRSVSDCHFPLSLPERLKTGASAYCRDRFRLSGRRRTGKEQKTSENDEKRKVGHFIPLDKQSVISSNATWVVSGSR